MEKLHEQLRSWVNSKQDIRALSVIFDTDSSDIRDIVLAIADGIDQRYTPKRTCYEAIKDMSFEELGEFIRTVYNKGWVDGTQHVSDESVFCCTMLDYPDTFLDEDWNEED